MPVSTFDNVVYSFRRFLIRSGRIAVGLLLAIVTLWIAAEAIDLLGRPFAAASLFSLAGGLFLGYLAFLAGSLALGVAFGEAPTREEHEEQRRTEAERVAATIKAAATKEAEQREEMQSLPLWKQALFDPTFARRRPGAFALVAAIGFAAIAGVIGLLVMAQGLSR